jgi:hypothetical protein
LKLGIAVRAEIALRFNFTNHEKSCLIYWWQQAWLGRYAVQNSIKPKNNALQMP